MRVLITGSRDWRDVKTIHRRLSELPRDSVIVHGAATGADHIAHSVALHLGMTPEPHFPDYVKYVAQVAPLERNKLMVDLGADLCLAFPTAKSRGTWHCLDLAKDAGILWEVIEQGSDGRCPHLNVVSIVGYHKCTRCGELIGGED